MEYDVELVCEVVDVWVEPEPDDVIFWESMDDWAELESEDVLELEELYRELELESVWETDDRLELESEAEESPEYEPT